MGTGDGRGDELGVKNSGQLFFVTAARTAFFCFLTTHMRDKGVISVTGKAKYRRCGGSAKSRRVEVDAAVGQGMWSTEEQ